MTTPPPLPPKPDRPDQSHKGTFGTVIVIGGQPTMPGAPALTASAALHVGAGLVKIATTESVMPTCLSIEPSATGIVMPECQHIQQVEQWFKHLPEHAVLAIGPGMGIGHIQRMIIHQAMQQHRPVILDADGLNNLADIGRLDCRTDSPLICTPHPGEYRRLAAALAVQGDPIQPQARNQAAENLARALNATVVLKGQNTVVTNGLQLAINQTGNPALATAGTGDVLTGIIAGLVAQHMSGFDAALLGTHLHGLAADLWADRFSHAGLTARQLIAELPHALARLD